MLSHHCDDSEQRCSECGAAVKSVSCGGRPASYFVCQHLWGCPERKPSWQERLHQ